MFFCLFLCSRAVIMLAWNQLLQHISGEFTGREREEWILSSLNRSHLGLVTVTFHVSVIRDFLFLLQLCSFQSKYINSSAQWNLFFHRTFFEIFPILCPWRGILTDRSDRSPQNINGRSGFLTYAGFYPLCFVFMFCVCFLCLNEGLCFLSCEMILLALF